MGAPSAMSQGGRQEKAPRPPRWTLRMTSRWAPTVGAKDGCLFRVFKNPRHTSGARRDSRAMSQVMPSEPPPPNDAALADPALRRALADFVRRRVPPADVDDVVQTVLCDALIAQGRPRDPEGLRRWLLGIARHKVVDVHRRARREPPVELPDIPEGPPPIEARELAQWAERQAGPERDAQKTLA